MKEKTHIYPLLKRNVPAHWTRIENRVGVGEPDVFGQHNGLAAWVELKLFKGNKFSFRPSQPAWIMMNISHGGRVFVLARKKDTMLLFNGKHIPELIRRGTAIVDGVKDHPEAPTNLSMDLADLVLLNKPWDWATMKEVLFGEQ